MQINYVDLNNCIGKEARLLLDVPYRDGWEHFMAVFAAGDDAPSLIGRVGHLIASALLLIPVINILVGLILRGCQEDESSSDAPGGAPRRCGREPEKGIAPEIYYQNLAPPLRERSEALRTVSEATFISERAAACNLFRETL
ncbi:MAG TPA: hypothetical protein DHV52_03495, partial [Parachlamydiales bacterium]|nr:hypothetical protein [Parachlamydiales bacterium]